jgi:hypothetical protein
VQSFLSVLTVIAVEAGLDGVDDVDVADAALFISVILCARDVIFVIDDFIADCFAIIDALDERVDFIFCFVEFFIAVV